MALSADEQFLIEMINRARLDPLGEAERFDIDLNQDLSAGTLDGSAKQVLAPNQLLHDAAEGHSDWMIATDTFSHTGVNDSTPGGRMEAAGYEFSGSYASGENIAYTGSTGPIDANDLMENNHHRNLFLSSGHRVNMLHDFYREIGVSQQVGVFTNKGTDYNVGMVTENFALSGPSVFVTGVVYSDTDTDGFYSIGEGTSGTTVTTQNSSTSSAAEGGYAIAVTAGTDVAVSLGDVDLLVDVSDGNGKLDLVDGTDVLTSVDTQLLSAAGSLRALGAADIDLIGHGGADVLIGNKGDNLLDGKGGTDIAHYDLARADAVIEENADGSVTVTSALGTDTLRNIETLTFSDQTIYLSELFTTAEVTAQDETLTGSDGDDALYAGGFSAGVAPTISAQVFRLYQATLDRAPDAAGHAGWTQQLFEGSIDLEDVSNGIVGSAEFQSTYGALDNDAFIDLLYNNVLGRAADDAGRAGWIEAMEQDGLSRAQAVLGFSESAEFKTNTEGAAAAFTEARDAGGLTDDVFRLYQATLDRSPDKAGFDGWIDDLTSGTDFLQAVSGFTNSVEFRATYGDLDNEAFVELLYNNVLDRPPDAAGRQAWIDLLETNGTRPEVVKAFTQSQEFINNTATAVHDWVAEQGIRDVIVGGAGDDILSGGALCDAFVFDASHDGNDTVLDLEAWDQIQLTGFGYETASDALLHMTQEGDAVVFADESVTITFVDSTLEMFTEEMFLL